MKYEALEKSRQIVWLQVCSWSLLTNRWAPSGTCDLTFVRCSLQLLTCKKERKKKPQNLRITQTLTFTVARLLNLTNIQEFSLLVHLIDIFIDSFIT